jgi:hypothetical protein
VVNIMVIIIIQIGEAEGMPRLRDEIKFAKWYKSAIIHFGVTTSQGYSVDDQNYHFMDYTMYPEELLCFSTKSRSVTQ